jgi:hypothetical protein
MATQIHPRCNDRPLWLKVATYFASRQFAWVTPGEVGLSQVQVQGLSQVGILQMADNKVALTEHARRVLYR